MALAYRMSVLLLHVYSLDVEFSTGIANAPLCHPPNPMANTNMSEK